MELNVREVRRLMAAKGYTVKATAKAAGVSPIALGKWLNHGVKPRLDTIGRLANALDVDLYDIAKD